jgi:hypothetical protein
LNCGGLEAEQLGQPSVISVPHSPQNFIPAGFSNWHFRHIMVSLAGMLRKGRKKKSWSVKIGNGTE